MSAFTFSYYRSVLGILAAMIAIRAYSAESTPAATGKSILQQTTGTAQAPISPFPNGRFALEHGDMVAFVGGGDVVMAQRTGLLETLLTLQFRDLGIRFRNFGWEGDTVFEQPRDVGFPELPVHLERAHASVIVLQYGRSEALTSKDKKDVQRFAQAYEKLLENYTRLTPRLVLVTPMPYESGGPLLPDLSSRNTVLADYAQAIRDLARRRNLPVVDLFKELGGTAHKTSEWTTNGLDITPQGQALVARGFIRQLGFGRLADDAGPVQPNGAWPNADFERLRQAIVSKNKLWFNYWRPQNWAFLGGDRTSQPSSRDYRDPSIRWFPKEMEEYVPLIQSKEREIEDLAKAVSGGNK